jgi:hypothetical protein
MAADIGNQARSAVVPDEHLAHIAATKDDVVALVRRERSMGGVGRSGSEQRPAFDLENFGIEIPAGRQADRRIGSAFHES